MARIWAYRVAMKTLAALALAVALILLPATPATAGEIDSETNSRAMSASINQAEAKRVVKFLLGQLVGPAISSDTKPMRRLAAWDCLTLNRVQAACQGLVKGGVVTCRGRFRVHKFAKSYAAFPLRMNCGVR